jgi:hypothetical protein
MIENIRWQYDFDVSQGSVVWPDPSPLSSWWEAVMRGDARQRAGMSKPPAAG